MAYRMPWVRTKCQVCVAKLPTTRAPTAIVKPMYFDTSRRRGQRLRMVNDIGAMRYVTKGHGEVSHHLSGRVNRRGQGVCPGISEQLRSRTTGLSYNLHPMVKVPIIAVP